MTTSTGGEAGRDPAPTAHTFVMKAEAGGGGVAAVVDLAVVAAASTVG